jgi:hypothetical protein
VLKESSASLSRSQTEPSFEAVGRASLRISTADRGLHECMSIPSFRGGLNLVEDIRKINYTGAQTDTMRYKAQCNGSIACSLARIWCEEGRGDAGRRFRACPRSVRPQRLVQAAFQTPSQLRMLLRTAPSRQSRLDSSESHDNHFAAANSLSLMQ